MSNKLFASLLAVVLPLALAAVLLVHPTQAKSENAKASLTEVSVDNFSFDPDTLTVSVNSAVTWVNKDDVSRNCQQ